ncbi:hypothetical protein DY000_02007398 [Brassica cretica]|uniref:Uncharacterized protein n=1 Tax=Brassica cretica TaxID=69181 RepID=A0ABQ7BUM5_BRACR|nr:hypothetical protein DY000_02007398 [Brassica cretica]
MAPSTGFPNESRRRPRPTELQLPDDSDYESTPVVPPNDEYVLEDELDEACTDSDSESDSSSYLSHSFSHSLTDSSLCSFDRNPQRIPSSPSPNRITAPRYAARETTMTLSEPSAMAPSFAPPGVVPPGAVPHASTPLSLSNLHRLSHSFSHSLTDFSLSLSTMAPSTGIPNESQVCMQQGRPHMTLSEPSAMTPSFAPPGVVPPGAVPHASVGSSSAVPAAPAPYVRRREDALLRAPSRRNQPHLHPDKISGALWFGIDPEVHAFIRATWQGNYWGSWASWNIVPPEKKDQWWHAFIQHYYWDDQFHDEIYLKWKKQTQVTICGRISQNRRDNMRPSYMSDAHWATMVEKYSTEQAKRKSAKAARSRKSAPVGKKMHKHGAGPRCFLNIAYNMMVDEGLDEPPSYTALARKTHTGKDGSFLDERTEELVLEVEEAVEEMLQDGSPLGDSQTDSTAASGEKPIYV